MSKQAFLSVTLNKCTMAQSPYDLSFWKDIKQLIWVYTVFKTRSRILKNLCTRPPDKSVYWTAIFLFLNQNNVVGTQKNRLNETVLLSTQNTY